MARSKSKKGQVPSELTLSVLGYREEGEWVAVALEMDLRGYGSTFAHAATELVATQIYFARFKGQPELIWKPADPVDWTHCSPHGHQVRNRVYYSQRGRVPEYLLV